MTLHTTVIDSLDALTVPAPLPTSDVIALAFAIACGC